MADRAPLSECSWFAKTPCGCYTGFIQAVSGDYMVATETDAWRHFYGRYPDVAAREADGYTVELWSRKLLRENRIELTAPSDCPHKAGESGD